MSQKTDARRMRRARFKVRVRLCGNLIQRCQELAPHNKTDDRWNYIQNKAETSFQRAMRQISWGPNNSMVRLTDGEIIG